MRTRIKIGGMHCGGCGDRVQRVLEREPGVRGAKVSHAEGAAVGMHDDGAADPGVLAELVRQAGYAAEVEG